MWDSLVVTHSPGHLSRDDANKTWLVSPTASEPSSVEERAGPHKINSAATGDRDVMNTRDASKTHRNNSTIKAPKKAHKGMAH